MSRHPRRTWLLVGLGLLVLLELGLLFPAGFGRTHVVDNGDAYLHMWNLWWVYRAVAVEHRNPYYTDYNGFPVEIRLTYHQLILPVGLLSIPLFGAGWLAGQVLLFWQYTAAVVGFVGMYLLVTRLRGPPAGAAVAGLYYVLSPLYWQNLPRPDSLSYVLFPWLILAVAWAGRGRRWRLAGPVFLGGILLLLSPYFGASLMLVWLAGLVPVWLEGNYPTGRFASFGPLVLLATCFQWLPQVLGERPVLVRPEVVEAFSADLSAYVLPPSVLWWVPTGTAWWTDTWTATEPSLYLGWFALGLAAVGWGRLATRWRGRLGVLTGGFLLLSLGPGIRLFGVTYLNGWLPFGWLMGLTDATRALRAPLRFGYVLVLLVALGVGRFFPRRTGWGLAAGTLIVLEMVRGPIAVAALPDARALRSVRERVEAPALVGVPLTDWATEVQYGQTIHGKKLAMIGLSYGVEALWERVGRNPVLHALYQREPLPARGWDRLRRQGYGGVIFHHRLFPKDLRTVRDDWRSRLRSRFGPPVFRGSRFELYRFGDGEGPSP